MNCTAFRQEFEALEIGEPPSAAAQAHLNSCPACRSFQSERLSLRQLVGSLGTVNAPPDFDFRLRARIAAAKSIESHAFHRSRFAPGLKAISVAASFALLITAAVVFKQSQSARVSAPFTSEQTAVVKENEGQPRQTENKPEQLANASQDKEARPVEVAATRPATSGGSQANNNAGKTAQAKSARGTTLVKRQGAPIISNDLALRGNPLVVTRDQQPPTNATGTTDAAATLLQVSPQPFKLLLHDKQGALRSVSLERVIFGSQNFMERDGQRPPSASDAEGIW
jgi:hypothetical protein